MAVPMFRNNVATGYQDPTKGIREGLLMMKMAQDSKDKNARLAMIDARDQRRYDLQQKRLNAKDARDASLIQGNLAAARATMTDPIDMYKTKMVEDRSNVTGREWDPATANANADKISVVDAFAPKAMKDKERLLSLEYDKIINNKEIGSSEKEKALHKLMRDKAGFTQDELDEEDGGITRLFKGMGRTMARPKEYSSLVASKIAGLVSPEKEREMYSDLEKENKELNDFYSIDSPIRDFKKRMASASKIRKENETGKAKYDAQIAKQKAELDLYAKKDKYGEKSSRVLKDRANYQKELNKKIQREIAKIPKGLDAEDKAIRETQIYNAFGKDLAGYTAEKAGILKFQQDMQKEDLKRIKDSAAKERLAEVNSKLRVMEAEAKDRAKRGQPPTQKEKLEMQKLKEQVKLLKYKNK